MLFDMKVALLCGLLGGAFSAVTYFESPKLANAPIYDVDYFHIAKEYQRVKNTAIGSEMKQLISNALQDNVITRQEYKLIMLEEASFFSDENMSAESKREFRREKLNLLKEINSTFTA